MLYQVPFYSQSWDLDNWNELGFESYSQAEYWERSCCGVLCLKMAIDYFKSVTYQPLSPTISKLIQHGLQLNAYTDESGWSHSGLVTLASMLGFNAKQTTITSPQQLKSALDAGRLPIISIKWAFVPTKTLKERLLFWKKFGGHLALVVGYLALGEQIIGFYVHHTSKIPHQNWISRLVLIDQFSSGFTGRSIIISKQ